MPRRTLWRTRRLRAARNFSFNFGNTVAESLFDFVHRRTFTEVTSLIEVLQIGAQLLQEFVGKSVTHTQPIVAHDSGARARLPAFGLNQQNQRFMR